MNKTLLTIDDLSVAFTMTKNDGALTKSKGIEKISLDLHAGEIVAVVGASGSGKSLLAHAILGILPYNAECRGKMYFRGDLLDEEKQAQLRGSKIALVPQSVTYLDPLMKVGKQVRGLTGALESQRTIFKQLQLDEYVSEYYPFELSGGMARRVLVSTALISEAEVIIADEPTPGMELRDAIEALHQFREMADHGKGVILITHDIDLGIEVADRLAVIFDGKLLDVVPSRYFKDGGKELKNPYTKALYRALPQNNFTVYTPAEVEHFVQNAGEVPSDAITAVERSGNIGGGEAQAVQNTETPLLEVKNLSFAYAGGKTVLDNFSFSIKQGEFVALLGPSGKGKSTLSKLLSGYLPIERGTVLLNGNPLPKEGYSPIQLIYQHPEKAMNPRMKMKDILTESWDIPQSLLEKMGVEEKWLNRWPNELSGGQLQRLSIVRALNPATRVLIADEITASLDPITQAQIWDVIVDECKKNKTALLVITHNMALAKRLCQRAVTIS